MDLSTTFDIDTSWLSEGRRTYELTNHLGNVLATISDKRIPVFENEGMTVAYYDVDLLSAVDYYPFGMQMPGREFNGGGYRYGFNGKENDNEVKGEGNQQDYGMRVYDPRLGRFLSVDPLSPDYPELTPYQYANNSPVTNIDADGLEDANSNVVTATKRGKAALKKVTDHVLKEQAKKAAEKMAAESAKRMAEEAAKKVGSPKSSTLIGLALSIVMELFTSPNDQHTADELYKGINPKNDPVVDRKDLPGWDSEMERQGHFMGLPLKEDVTKDEEKKNVYIHYSDRKSIVEIAGTRVLIPNKKNKVYLTKALLTEKQVEELLFLGIPDKKGKGKYMVVFAVDPDQDTNIQADPSNILEYIYDRGTLKIREKNLIYIGPNPKKDEEK